LALWTAGRISKGRAALAGLGLLAAPLALGGCVDTTADVAPSVDAHHELVRREGVSIARASVAIVSIDGAPASVAAAFREDLAREAHAREIAIAEPSKARYLVRGYLSAELTTDGAEIEYVWDVFTADKRRAQRLNDVIAVQGTGDDPWTVAGPAALASVAAKSADDLAAYLSNTPEAVAVAAPSSAVAHREAAAAPLSYARAQ
jgi:hypothetical protein